MSPAILLVEDNNESRYLFSFILRRHGCRVMEARNGVEALALIESESNLPDLVIMDIQMPVMDGYETVARMRADERMAKVPILGLSAFAMSSDRQKALLLGFTGYIEKPIEFESFMRALSAYLPTLARP
jgi:two-component system cell cycle response regulator DivK